MVRKGWTWAPVAATCQYCHMYDAVLTPENIIHIEEPLPDLPILSVVDSNTSSLSPVTYSTVPTTNVLEHDASTFVVPAVSVFVAPARCHILVRRSSFPVNIDGS